MKDLGMKTVVKPPPRVEQTMWKLFLEYEREMKMKEIFQPGTEFVKAFPTLDTGKSEITNPTTMKLVFVESTKGADTNEVKYQIYGLKEQNGSINWTMNTVFEGWTSES